MLKVTIFTRASIFLITVKFVKEKILEISTVPNYKVNIATQ